jgi:hypothetical protein
VTLGVEGRAEQRSFSGPSHTQMWRGRCRTGSFGGVGDLLAERSNRAQAGSSMLRSLVLILACWYRAGTAQAAESKEGRLELVLNPSFELDSANATFRSNRVDATCRRREEVYAEVHQTEAQLARRTLSARLLPSLRVHWTFEDGDGANITDMSGKGNAHATLKVKEEAQSGEQVVPASWEPSSLAGGSWAVHFRSHTYLEGPSAASVGMSSSGARTIMAWIKLYDGVGNAGIVTYGRSSLSRAFSLRVEGERIALDLRGPRAFGSGDTAVPSNMWSRSTFMVDTWHQVVFTYDGGQTDVSMTAYFDGMQSNQGRPTGAPRTDVDEPIYVHHNFNDDVGTASYFVDEVALFDTALSAVDVGLLYNHGQGLGACFSAAVSLRILACAFLPDSNSCTFSKVAIVMLRRFSPGSGGRWWLSHSPVLQRWRRLEVYAAIGLLWIPGSRCSKRQRALERPRFARGRELRHIARKLCFPSADSPRPDSWANVHTAVPGRSTPQ